MQQGEKPTDETKLAPLDEALVQRTWALTVDDPTRKTARTLDFNVFNYKDTPHNSDEQLLLVKVIVFFFEDLGLVSTLGMDCEILTRFIVRARSMYRNVAYHNFSHAFDVTHMVWLWEGAGSPWGSAAVLGGPRSVVEK